MTSLSGNQQEKLEKLKKNITDILKPEHDDYYLYRWLKARNFDLAESEKMLRDHLKWREIVKADEILTNWTPPPVLLAHYPGGLHGFDKTGRPIWIEPIGKADVKGIMASVKKSDLMKYKIWHCEILQKTLHEQYVKLGRNVGVVVLLDLESFSMKHLWKPALDFYTDTLAMFEANYPETLGVSYVINAPTIFPLVYSLVKPFLSADTKRKICILGGSWKNELLKCIDADQLPVHWGGTVTDPDGDPCCRSKVGCGGKVDPKYYNSEDYSCVDQTALINVTVGRRASIKLPFQIDRPGSSLRWQFISEGSDIGFGISCKPLNSSNEAEEETVVQTTRLNSHMVPEDGSINCQKPGLYTVTFDNSYSWIHSKKLLYQIDILPPPENCDELKISSSFTASLLEQP